MTAPVRVGVVGVGYWGPNLLRNFHNCPGAEATWACDLNADRLAHMGSLYPTVKTTSDYQELLDDEALDAVVLATPANTHCELACRAMDAGKHVFVEKPMANSAEECRRMVAKAEETGRKIMVGHTFLYNSVVKTIKEMITSGELGDILYIYINRLNLGLFRDDCNVVWDLAPHDIAILGYLLDSDPESLVATGHAYVQPKIEDVAFINLRYPGGVMAHLHVSWLDPNKVRRLTIVGSKKMLVYDDVSTTEKLRIYDKGVTVLPHYDTFGEFQLSYRYGDIVLPRIDDSEPLKHEAQHFVDAIREDRNPLSDGQNGLVVVEALEAACRSIEAGGQHVELNGVRSQG